MNLLFVTWDGPRLPYLEGLFLPIFGRLRERGVAAHVVQFGWSEQDEVERIAGRCAAESVPYRYRPVWRRPVSLGSLATALAGRGAVAAAIRDWDIDLVMPRSYLPALAAIPPARAAGCAVLLDADGLPNDERIDFAGARRSSSPLRMLDYLEGWAVRRADAITVRTSEAAAILAKRAGISAQKFTVVANVRDEETFHPPSPEERADARAGLGIPAEVPLAIFVGSSVDGKYDGVGLIAFLRALRSIDPRSMLLIVTPECDRAKDLVAKSGIEPDAVIVTRARPDEVPALIGAADVGLSFIHPTPSMRGAAAIKTGEYLLCGIPVIATAGVGGVEHVLTERSGFIVNGAVNYGAAARWLTERVLAEPAPYRGEARRVGEVHFGMAAGVCAYDSAMDAALAADRRAEDQKR